MSHLPSPVIVTSSTETKVSGALVVTCRKLMMASSDRDTLEKERDLSGGDMTRE